MLERKKQQVEVELTAEEKAELLKFFEQMDTRMLASVAEAISMMVRAFEGRPIEAQDIITKLTNVKNILERSRFPTYPLLAKQVYLRLIAKYHPEAYACRDWADLEAQALIEYKGQGRDEYVEMTKAVAYPEEQEIFVGAPQQTQIQAKKRRFWHRGRPKTEPSEFVEE